MLDIQHWILAFSLCRNQHQKSRAEGKGCENKKQDLVRNITGAGTAYHRSDKNADTHVQGQPLGYHPELTVGQGPGNTRH